MVSTDPISDMLTRIRNAIAVNNNEVTLPHSKIKARIAKQLKDSNFISDVSVENSGINKTMKIVINEAGSNARITHMERISKPGRRMYAKADEIPTVKNGRGIVIVSTSKGVMTGTEANKKRLGGELICKVY